MRARLATVSDDEARQAGASAAAWLRASPRWDAARTVLVYAAVRGEVDPHAIAAAAWQDGKRVLLPCPVPATRALAPCVWPPGGALVAGPYGIGVPVGGAGGPESDEEADVVVVPGLAFDRAGGRIGSGLGYYDRWLAAHPTAWAVGLAYAWQVVEAVPTGPHDVRLAALATADGLTGCRPGARA